MKKTEAIEIVKNSDIYKENKEVRQALDTKLIFKKVENYILLGSNSEKYILLNKDYIFTISIALNDNYSSVEFNLLKKEIESLEHINNILKEEILNSCTLNDNHLFKSPPFKKLSKIEDYLFNEKLKEREENYKELIKKLINGEEGRHHYKKNISYFINDDKSEIIEYNHSFIVNNYSKDIPFYYKKDFNDLAEEDKKRISKIIVKEIEAL